MKGTLNQYFKLGQEGKYRIYHNQYSSNALALNKHQHREASSMTSLFLTFECSFITASVCLALWYSSAFFVFIYCFYGSASHIEVVLTCEHMCLYLLYVAVYTSYYPDVELSSK